jgi:hypothetical protein
MIHSVGPGNNLIFYRPVLAPQTQRLCCSCVTDIATASNAESAKDAENDALSGHYNAKTVPFSAFLECSALKAFAVLGLGKEELEALLQLRFGSSVLLKIGHPSLTA